MECSCRIGSCGDDACEVLLAKWVKCLKPQKCSECDKEIVRGELYFRETTLFDGLFDSFATCSDCHSLRENLFDGWTYGEIKETISDVIESGLEIPEKCIAELTPLARAWVCELIEREWERT